MVKPFLTRGLNKTLIFGSWLLDYENEMTKDRAVMLEDITIDTKTKSFVNFFQHGGFDVTCKPRI